MVKLFSLLFILLSFSFSNLLPDEKRTIGAYVPDIRLQDHEGKVYSLKEAKKLYHVCKPS